MLLQGLVTGVIVGFIISMPPLGPTYFAIIERALKKELNNAVAIGAGAGFLDMVYVLVSFGGVSAIASLLPEVVDNFFSDNETAIKLIFAVAGCLVVILYGIKMLLTSKKGSPEVANVAGEPPEMAAKVEEMESKILSKEKSLGKLLHIERLNLEQSDVIGSFFLGIGFCLSSVTLPASWLAIVSYLKSYGIIDSNFSTGLMLGIGVMFGTVLFFYLFSRILTNNTHKIKPNLVSKLNLLTGIFLILLGTGILFKISSVLFE